MILWCNKFVHHVYNFQISYEKPVFRTWLKFIFELIVSFFGKKSELVLYVWYWFQMKFKKNGLEVFLNKLKILSNNLNYYYKFLVLLKNIINFIESF